MKNPEIITSHGHSIPVIMGGVMLGLLLAALDGTIMSTVMPTIITRLGGMEFYTWPFTIYMLASTISIIIFGKISDLFGRKRVFNTGIGIFLIGSLLSGLSPGMIYLILFRLIQGIGGGILLTVSFIMVAELFPVWERGKYMGILASVFGIASIIGPLIGGYITEHIGWPWVFYVNIPIGILSFCMIWRFFPDIAPVAQSRSIDYAGIITFTAAMIPLFLGLSLAGTVYPWASPEIIGMMGTSAILFIIFIRTQLKAQEPVLAVRMFHNRVYAISMIDVFLGNALFYAAIIYLPLFVQDVLKTNASMAGMIITPMVISVVLAAIVSGQVISRTRRYKTLALFAFAIMGVSTALFSTINTDTSFAELIFGSILLGFGAGIMDPLFSVAAQNAFSPKEIGVITSSLQFSRNMGATVITPLLAFVMYNSLNITKGSVDISGLSPDSLAHAISLVFEWCLVIAIVSCALTLLLEDAKLKPREKPGEKSLMHPEAQVS